MKAPRTPAESAASWQLRFGNQSLVLLRKHINAQQNDEQRIFWAEVYRIIEREMYPPKQMCNSSTKHLTGTRNRLESPTSTNPTQEGNTMLKRIKTWATGTSAKRSHVGGSLMVLRSGGRVAIFVGVGDGSEGRAKFEMENEDARAFIEELTKALG
jgi:hypothetical protein